MGGIGDHDVVADIDREQRVVCARTMGARCVAGISVCAIVRERSPNRISQPLVEYPRGERLWVLIGVTTTLFSNVPS